MPYYATYCAVTAQDSNCGTVPESTLGKSPCGLLAHVYTSLSVQSKPYACVIRPNMHKALQQLYQSHALRHVGNFACMQMPFVA